MANNWKHILPKNEEPKHDVTWPDEGQSKCACKPSVDQENRIVRHRPLQ